MIAGCRAMEHLRPGLRRGCYGTEPVRPSVGRTAGKHPRRSRRRVVARVSRRSRSGARIMSQLPSSELHPAFQTMSRVGWPIGRRPVCRNVSVAHAGHTKLHSESGRNGELRACGQRQNAQGMIKRSSAAYRAQERRKVWFAAQAHRGAVW